MALKAAYESLPTPPVSTNAPLAAAATVAVPNDSAHRISSLPDLILRDIVSRLPAKDAVRTGALATRWRGFWRTVSLVFLDASLLPKCAKDPPGVRRSRTRSASSTRCPPSSPRTQAPFAASRSPAVSCTSLTRLHIGAWKLPNIANLPEAAGFPHLQELFLSLITMKDRDLAFFLDRSPVLEVLTIIASLNDVRLCLVSHSLRCLQLGMSSVGDIAVADAPRLERLLLWMTRRRRTGDNKFSRIKIGKAPNLNALGYWHPGQHELQIGDAIIKADTKGSPSTIIPSIETLALDVHFDIRNEVKKVPTFLKCFPNIETLHVKSLKTNKPAGKVNLKFWQEACPAQCVQHVKKLVIHEFQGNKNEHAFIKFVGETSQALEKFVVMICPQSFSSSLSPNGLDAKMKPFTTVKWASAKMKKIVFKFPSNPTPWSFRMVVDVSCRDPFDLDSAMPTDVSSSDDVSSDDSDVSTDD